MFDYIHLIRVNKRSFKFGKKTNAGCSHKIQRLGYKHLWCSERYIIPLVLNREENACIITQLMTSNKEYT